MLAPKRGTSNNTLLVVVTLPFLLLTGLAAHALNESLFFLPVSSFLLASLFRFVVSFILSISFGPENCVGFSLGLSAKTGLALLFLFCYEFCLA